VELHVANATGPGRRGGPATAREETARGTTTVIRQ
jgi:hypothetical protein